MTAGPTAGAALWRWAAVAAALVAAVVVPFLLFEDAMGRATHWAAGIGGGWGVALLALLLAGDILLPVPSSVVSTACGFLLGFPAGTAASTVGLTAGGVIGYALGRGLGGARLERLVTPTGAESVSAVFARHGAWALVLLRGVPVLAEVSVVVAGMTRLPFDRFLAATLLSNLGLSAAYAAAGAWAMDGAMDAALLPFAAAVGLPAAARLFGLRLTAPPAVTGGVR